MFKTYIHAHNTAASALLHVVVVLVVVVVRLPYTRALALRGLERITATYHQLASPYPVCTLTPKVA